MSEIEYYIYFTGTTGWTDDGNILAIDDIDYLQGEKCDYQPAVADPARYDNYYATCNFDYNICEWIQSTEGIAHVPTII